MKKNIKDLAMRAGMTGMAALSMAGALAGTAFAGQRGDNSTAGVIYHTKDSTGTVTDEDASTNMGGEFDETGDTQSMHVSGDENDKGIFGGPVKKSTKVVVDQMASVAVEVPFKITLNGAAGAENKAEYKIRVKGDIDGSTQINVVPNTATAEVTGVTGSKTDDDFGKTKPGEGTFPMIESAHVKTPITATIKQAKDNTRWTMAKDGGAAGDGVIDEGVTATLDKTKTGTVEVANLSAGKWENTIGFDISATDTAANGEYKDVDTAVAP